MATDIVQEPDGTLRVAGVSPQELRDALAIGRLATQLGLTRDEVQTLVASLSTATRAQAERDAARRDTLIEALTGMPDASKAQARRVAETHQRLLSSPVHTIQSLAAARGASPEATRKWLSRKRHADQLFTVSHGGETIVPGFLLRDRTNPYPQLAAVIAPLRGIGMDGWSLWVWFDTPSSWLDDERPVDLISQGRFRELAAAAASQAAAAAA